MEEKPRELESTSAKTFSFLSFLCSDPLFSSIITLYTLIFLYFPHISLRIIFSPVLISTGILLLTLLRLGAIQRTQTENDSAEPQEQESESPNEDRKWVESKTKIEAETEMGFDPNPIFADSFVEWNVGAPLEVIYEEYEGEEAEDPNEKEENRSMGMERFPSLSLYYPESDTETSSDGEFPANGEWDSLENICFRWEEEEHIEGLIEIDLDGKKRMHFHAEEENMIEIDISPGRNGEFSGENMKRFSGKGLDSVNFD
ncbi:hypothetical protein L1049_009787 [Liquidambar formosana]|uniref:Uncharacterized protein n=1 Tax=Liquidambar formosana TaxID=63359 RepID=A0AAP0N6D0_LIQFO